MDKLTRARGKLWDYRHGADGRTYDTEAGRARRDAEAIMDSLIAIMDALIDAKNASAMESEYPS